MSHPSRDLNSTHLFCLDTTNGLVIAIWRRGGLVQNLIFHSGSLCFLCFACHSTVVALTNREKEKYGNPSEGRAGKSRKTAFARARERIERECVLFSFYRNNVVRLMSHRRGGCLLRHVA